MAKLLLTFFRKGDKIEPYSLPYPLHVAAWTTRLITMRHISRISLVAFASVGFAGMNAQAASLPTLPSFTVPTAPAFTVPTKPVVVAAPKPMSASTFLALTKKH